MQGLQAKGCHLAASRPLAFPDDLRSGLSGIQSSLQEVQDHMRYESESLVGVACPSC